MTAHRRGSRVPYGSGCGISQNMRCTQNHILLSTSGPPPRRLQYCHVCGATPQRLFWGGGTCVSLITSSQTPNEDPAYPSSKQKFNVQNKNSTRAAGPPCTAPRPLEVLAQEGPSLFWFLRLHALSIFAQEMGSRWHLLRPWAASKAVLLDPQPPLTHCPPTVFSTGASLTAHSVWPEGPDAICVRHGGGTELSPSALSPHYQYLLRPSGAACAIPSKRPLGPMGPMRLCAFPNRDSTCGAQTYEFCVGGAPGRVPLREGLQQWAAMPLHDRPDAATNLRCVV
jgi:hypothetical protein|mmetsp:Transcript_13033/g.23757  ORF Transcript_13033/g.23757 Transcript_13033/m.23757 type:complete len:283 (-) Transcript_13033:285-1133(-)